MSKAFPSPGKGFPRSLEALRAAVKGGVVADSVSRTSGASAIALDASVYKHLIRTGGTAGNEIVQVPVPTEVGQRVLIDFEVEGNVADVVRINGDGTSTLQKLGAVGEVAVAVVNIDLDTPGEFALLEYQGANLWNLLYTTGVAV